MYVYTTEEGKIKTIKFSLLLSSLFRLYILESSEPTCNVEHLKNSLKFHQNIADQSFGTVDDLLHLYPSRNGRTFCDLLCSSLFPSVKAENIYPKSFLGNIIIPLIIERKLLPEEMGLIKMIDKLRASPHTPTLLKMEGYARFLSIVEASTKEKCRPPSIGNLYTYMAGLKEEKEVPKKDLEYYKALFSLLSEPQGILFTDGTLQSPRNSPIRLLSPRPDPQKLLVIAKCMEELETYNDSEALSLMKRYKELHALLTKPLSDFIQELSS